VDPGKLNKRVLEALIQSGACDALGPNRATLMAQLPEAVRAAEQHQRDRAAGQNDMFGMADSTAAATPVIHVAAQPEWPLERKLAGERATLGHYFSGHPTDPWREVLAQLGNCPLGEIAQRYTPPARRDNDDGNRFRRAQETPWTIGGMVTLQRRRGDSAAFVQFEDWSGHLEVSFFREALADYAHLLLRDAILVVEGGLALDDFSGELQLRARRVWTLDEACAAHTRVLRLGVNGIGPPFVDSLKRAINGHRGGTTRLLLTGYRNAQGCADLELGEDWRVRVTTDLLRALNELPGVRSVAPAMARPAAG
jgi:DNA polymerase-3 subunit alpha